MSVCCHNTPWNPNIPWGNPTTVFSVQHVSSAESVGAWRFWDIGWSASEGAAYLPSMREIATSLMEPIGGLDRTSTWQVAFAEDGLPIRNRSASQCCQGETNGRTNQATPFSVSQETHAAVCGSVVDRPWMECILQQGSTCYTATWR